MFSQYFQLGHRLRAHYLSPTVLLCLVTGRFVPPIHRKSLYSLQYSMLPARRASVLEVWTRLTEKSSPRLTNGDIQGVPKKGAGGRRGR
jgi:phosphatidylinositol glycan class Q protein